MQKSLTTTSAIWKNMCFINEICLSFYCRVRLLYSKGIQETILLFLDRQFDFTFRILRIYASERLIKTLNRTIIDRSNDWINTLFFRFENKIGIPFGAFLNGKSYYVLIQRWFLIRVWIIARLLRKRSFYRIWDSWRI